MSTPFEDAVLFSMKYEVGAWFKLDADTIAGLCSTAEQKRNTGYVNDPTDPGGETKFGVAQNSNPDLNIKTLTWEQAKERYRKNYWDAAKCQLLAGKVAVAHFDAAVNHGPGRAIKFLQEASGIKTENIDGVFGPGTMKAVGIASANTNLVARLIAVRRQFYKDIIARNPTQVRFQGGWNARCDDLQKVLA